MAERRKPKRSDSASDRPAQETVGAALRAARVEKKMEIDDVCHAINLRHAQIKAIEENDIESLPGMTYAVGFVRSYANFLGLNGAEVVHRFKVEHGDDPPPSNLNFPEPITESRVPSPIMVGVGAFFAVIVLVGWTIYSNAHDAGAVSSSVPATPVVTGIAGTAPSSSSSLPPSSSPPLSSPSSPTNAFPPMAPPSAAAEKAPPPAVAVAPAETAALKETGRKEAEKPAVSAAPAVADAKQMSPQTVATPSPVKAMPAKPVAETVKVALAPPVAAPPKAAPKIVVHAPKSDVTLRARDASWIQITDEHGNVLYRKVLRPGEKYDVPAKPGLSLDTANAGGLEIYVDGKRVQNIGGDGEILRGISLSPKELKIKREAIRG